MGEVILEAAAAYGLAIAVSLVVAVLIKGIVAALGALERRRTAVRPVPGPEAIDAAQVAAIAAALHAVVGEHRIVHIEAGPHAAWSAEGRLAQHASHGIERHHRK